MSTAKLKLLLIVIPVFFIRSYYRTTSTKLVSVLTLSILALLFLSLVLLNKIAGDENVFNVVFSAIGNYTFFNLFAFDALGFRGIAMGTCIDNQSACSFLPFYEYGDFRTNIYTVMYSFTELNIYAYLSFQFLIGLIHNFIARVAIASLNGFFIIFSSVLYVPLVFQIMDNQYVSSKYLIYIMTISYVLFLFKTKNITLSLKKHKSLLEK